MQINTKMSTFLFDAYQLRTIFDVLKDLLTHCWLIFDGDVLSITNMDPEKIVHVQTTLISKKSTNNTVKYRFSTYAQTLYKMFRTVTQGQEVSIILNPDDNQLQFKITKAGFSIVSRLTSLAIDCINFEVIPANFLDFQKLSTIHLHKIMYTLSSVSRIASITWNEDRIDFSANDNIQTHLSIACPLEQSSMGNPQTVKIVIKYLEKFCNRNIDKVIRLGISTDRRIIAVYDLPNGDLCLTMASLE